MFPIRTSIARREIPGAVIALIIANLAVYIFQAGLPPEAARGFILEYALVPAWLDAGGWTPWPLLTNIFMHGGIIHLAVNMWTLWLFGRALEDAFGSLQFFAFYLACGVLASLAHLAFNLGSGVPALGASGAIAGVLGGFTLLHAKARITLVTPILFFPIVYSLPALVYTAVWFAFQIVPGILELQRGASQAGIAWWAHIGGLGAGLGLTWLITRIKREDQPGPRTTGGRTGHRPRIIAVGTERNAEPIIGLQRPAIIRIGVARGRTQPHATVPPKTATAAPPAAASVSVSSSSVPITHRAAAKAIARLPETRESELDIWRRSGG
jgi:membrane associated rhomboid family serine protease